VTQTRLFLLLGSINSALAVMLGAFGAHGLRGKISPELLGTYQTGVQYHFYHALGLLILAFAAAQMKDSRLVPWAGGLMLTGIVLFSGSLYALSLTGVKALGAITPFGGAAFIGGWVLLAVAAWMGG
jgi:uncharacterized membrane protein YgdD (TMEM256/DUF423 family)